MDGAQGLFFVMNIVLASVYSNYKRGLDLRASQFQDARHKSLDIAYDILTKHNLHHAKREVSRDRLQTTGLCVVCKRLRFLSDAVLCRSVAVLCRCALCSFAGLCCQSDGAVFWGAGPAGASLPRARA